jgi:hypothetical protein
MPLKPIRDGIKLYALCCPYTGYVWDIIVHHWTAADKTNPAYVAHWPHSKGVAALVCALASTLHHEGHVVYMDSYFCTLGCVRALAAKGYGAVGSVKPKSGVPQTLLWPKKSTRFPFGSSRHLRSADGLIGVQQWVDNAVVTVISTVHACISGTVDGIRKMPYKLWVNVTRRRKNRGGVHNLHHSVQPKVIFDYTDHMRCAPRDICGMCWCCHGCALVCDSDVYNMSLIACNA